MSSAPVPHNERQRLFALAQLGVLDTAREEDFDKITRLVAAICEVPSAMLSFIDTERQWFKSTVGFSVCETARDSSFCAYAIARPGELFVVEDALADSRFRDNPLVVGEPHIRFYAGAPLTTPAGFALGSLCVVDYVARTLSVKQHAALQDAARSTVALLEHRRTYAHLYETYATSPDPTADTVARFALGDRRVYAGRKRSAGDARNVPDDLPAAVVDSIPGIFYLFDENGKFLVWNQRLADVTGYGDEEVAEINALRMIEAEDRPYVADRIRRAFVQGSASVDATLMTKAGAKVPYSFTGRVVHYRGKSCIAGVGLDLSARRQTEGLLEYAMSHDSLTGLGNRNVLSERLRQSAQTARRTGGRVAVVLLDLDRFKLLNDTFGHIAGNEVIKVVARRLLESVRPADTVARLGGDEFVIVADASSNDDVISLVNGIMRAFVHPFL